MTALHRFRVVAGSRTSPPPGAGGSGRAGPGRADAHEATDPFRHFAEATLRRLLRRVSSRPARGADLAGRERGADLEACLCSTAAISGALFGPSRTPDPLHRHLVALCDGLASLPCDATRVIRTDVAVEGRCPAALDDTVVRVAYELVGNAVEHGMRGRTVGRVDVLVHTEAGRTTLTVADDGRGCGDAPASGGGLTLAASLAARAGGGVRLRRIGDLTVAKLTLPHGLRAPARPSPKAIHRAAIRPEGRSREGGFEGSDVAEGIAQRSAGGKDGEAVPGQGARPAP